MAGWIKLHRQITNWGWYSDVNVSRLFIHLILTANHEDREWKGMVVKRGQVVTGRDKLSHETSLSAQEIRTALNKLKSTGEITIKATSKFSTVTVCNYEKYNSESNGKQPGNQPTDQPAEQPTSNHKQEVKNKEERKELCNEPASVDAENAPKAKKDYFLKEFELFWDTFADKRGRAPAIKSWKAIKGMNTDLIGQIIAGAKRYADHRVALIESKGTPKMAQGWLTDRRWEDEFVTTSQQKKTCETCDYWKRGYCREKGEEERKECKAWVESRG